EASTHDAAVSRMIRGTLARRGPRARLLCWHTASERPGRGRWRALTPEEVKTDIHERTGGGFTAKDFRTLHGSAAAAAYLAHAGSRASEPERPQVNTAAVQHGADVPGHTPAATRERYIDPRIRERYQAGEEFPRTSRTPESAPLHLLHSPG